jgi:hypothetical protein
VCCLLLFSSLLLLLPTSYSSFTSLLRRCVPLFSTKSLSYSTFASLFLFSPCILLSDLLFNTWGHGSARQQILFLSSLHPLIGTPGLNQHRVIDSLRLRQIARLREMSYLGNDRYNGGDRDRDRSRGSRDRTTLESDYGRLNERGDTEWGYGRGRGRSPGKASPLLCIQFASHLGHEQQLLFVFVPPLLTERFRIILAPGPVGATDALACPVTYLDFLC